MLKMQGQGGSQDASPDESLPTRWREITEDEAIEIFQAKMNRTGADSTRLALRYGITAKAVRDVWVMRSWITTTMPFWTKEDVLQYLRSMLICLLFSSILITGCGIVCVHLGPLSSNMRTDFARQFPAL